VSKQEKQAGKKKMSLKSHVLLTEKPQTIDEFSNKTRFFLFANTRVEKDGKESEKQTRSSSYLHR
jgi:hypothetical protein